MQVFVTCAVDNLDESGRVEFHGTALSLTSHVTKEEPGETPPPLNLDVPAEQEIKLPEHFANVPYIDEYTGDIVLQPAQVSLKPNVAVDISLEKSWMQHTYNVMQCEILNEVPITYSGFFFSQAE